MFKPAFAAVALIAASIVGSLAAQTKPTTPPDLGEMPEFARRDAVSDAEAAVKRGDHHFVGVRGFSTELPAVPDVNEYDVFIAQVIAAHIIEGTSDSIESDEQGRLNHACLRYAERYNRVILELMPSTQPGAERIGPKALHDAIDVIRVKRNVPAVGVLVSDGGRIIARDAWGEARTNDRWHIGSDTKAMTATLAAKMIERDKDRLNWNSTLAECCPQLAGKINAGYRTITLEQLLTHSSGVTDPPSGGWLNDMRRLEGDALMSPAERREAVLSTILQSPPTTKPGVTYAYSNLGYIIAGHMMESVDDGDWEAAIDSLIFRDLKMPSAYFGAPFRLRGHDAVGNPTTLDNPATLGPAGTVNLTLDDWLKFCEVHAGHGPQDFLSKESLAKLHTPVLNNYAMGWIVIRGGDGTPVLTHDGSNTFWYARSIIRPSDDRIILIALNKADPTACDEITAAVTTTLFASPTAPTR